MWIPLRSWQTPAQAAQLADKALNDLSAGLETILCSRCPESHHRKSHDEACSDLSAALTRIALFHDDYPQTSQRVPSMTDSAFRVCRASGFWGLGF